MRSSCNSLLLIVASALIAFVGAHTSVDILAEDWCNHEGGVTKAGDFDGDGYDDVMCFDKGGTYWIKYAKVFKSDQYLSAMDGWCAHDGANRYIADFNGDGRDDLLCHDTAGQFWIALADVEGKFSAFGTYKCEVNRPAAKKTVSCEKDW